MCMLPPPPSLFPSHPHFLHSAFCYEMTDKVRRFSPGIVLTFRFPASRIVKDFYLSEITVYNIPLEQCKMNNEKLVPEEWGVPVMSI